MVCLVAKDDHPYKHREVLTLKYDVCTGNNIRDVYMKTFLRYYPKPTGSPDQTMILDPFWSTWNEFNAGVNQTIVLAHAARIIQEGYLSNSHFEIDDGWEATYGQNEFDPIKFPDPAGTRSSHKRARD
jgi:hypothetical protein